jgi:hypothetical protein
MTGLIPVGFDLRSLSIQEQVPINTIVRLNHITSPSELYIGAYIVLPEQTSTNAKKAYAALTSGLSLLEMAVAHKSNPWSLAKTNYFNGTWDNIPGETFFTTVPSGGNGSASPSPYLENIDIKPVSILQGSAAIITIKTNQPMELKGNLAGHDLVFFEDGINQYTTLQGISGIFEPGLTPLKITANLDGNTIFELEQSLLVNSGEFSHEDLVVDPSTIDSAVIKSEDNIIYKLVRPVTPKKYWKSDLYCPVEPPSCIQSTYGTRRSYNEGVYASFHSGLDFGVCSNLNILSPAEGVVVYVGNLVIRGNATIIDHGWGVYSGIYHQSEIKVKVGDHVTEGQIIGLIGATGRVTGAHLHYDLWVNSVQVNPLNWLGNTCK